MNARTLLLIFCAFALAMGACSSDSGSSTGATATDDGASTPTQGDEYFDGVSKTSDSGWTVAIVQATPAPPDKGMNQWMVTLTDEDGAPVSGAEIVFTPDMPQHGHGTIPKTFSGTEGDPGTYAFDPMNLFMPGLWVVEVAITIDGTTETVSFAFELEG